MRSHPVLRLPLVRFLLLLGFLVGCGGSGDAPADEVAASDAPPAVKAPETPPGDGCPFSEDPSTTYEPGELLLKFTFQYPSSWEITNETNMSGGMVRLTMRRPFEVNEKRRNLALELIQVGRASTKEAVDRMVAPMRMGEMSANQEHEEIQLGDEAISIGKTITNTKVVYTLGVPGDGGYHLTNLHMQWAGDELCKEEVLRLGSEMLNTFALR